MVEAYRQRTYDEDVKYLENDLKGVEGLEESLKTTVEKGLTGHDFEERDSVFGSNQKEPFKRTSKRKYQSLCVQVSLNFCGWHLMI